MMMRYVAALLVPVCLGSLGGQAIAADPVPTVVAQETGDRVLQTEFWPQAYRLVQEQSFLIDRIEEALLSPDPNRVRAAEGQITLHLGAVDRFLRSAYPLPDLLCGDLAPSLPATGASASLPSGPQVQAYCGLYAAADRLKALRPDLDRRVMALGSVAEVEPLPLVSGEVTVNRAGVPQMRHGNLRDAADSVQGRVPAAPMAMTPVVEQPMKPLVNYSPPMQPAIAPPDGLLTQVRSIRALNEQIQAAFPGSPRFANRQEMMTSLDELTYDLYEPEADYYQAFLAQPNTGIARLLPAAVYQPDPNQLRNRLMPTVEERYPFSPLLAQRAEGSPLLALQVAGDRLQFAPVGLHYGFMADLGQTPLDALDAQLKVDRQVLSPELRSLFMGYQPPETLADLQRDQRRFLRNKGDERALETFQNGQIPLVVGHTYLVRSLQFELPEAIVEGRPLPVRDRRYLELRLDTDSSDVLVAVRPISRRVDGSYTVLWQLIEEFPDPTIRDLDQYVRFE